ncbi:MAG: type II toxin-antitoxin system PemK/MazF family toxin [Candidatus Binataceae bacterium]
MPNRGEVWLANLSPRRGTEPGKTRPVLIVQVCQGSCETPPLTIV